MMYHVLDYNGQLLMLNDDYDESTYIVILDYHN